MEHRTLVRRSTDGTTGGQSDASSRALLLLLRARLRRGPDRDPVAAPDPGAAPCRVLPRHRRPRSRLGRRRAAPLPAVRWPALPREVRAPGRAPACGAEKGELAPARARNQGPAVRSFVDRAAAQLRGL